MTVNPFKKKKESRSKLFLKLFLRLFPGNEIRAIDPQIGYGGANCSQLDSVR